MYWVSYLAEMKALPNAAGNLWKNNWIWAYNSRDELSSPAPSHEHCIVEVHFLFSFELIQGVACSYKKATPCCSKPETIGCLSIYASRSTVAVSCSCFMDYLLYQIIWTNTNRNQ